MTVTPSEVKVPHEVISLGELVKSTGKAKEFFHHDKARFGLARWMLAVLFITTLISLIAMMICPPDRLIYAREFFSFVKSAVPPLVTLVAGFYFGQSRGS